MILARLAVDRRYAGQNVGTGMLRDALSRTLQAADIAGNLVTRYREGGDYPVLRGAPCTVIAVTPKSAPWGSLDASVALTYFILAAHSRNIGCCWSRYGIRALEDYPPLRDFVGIGETLAAQAVAFFGHPAISYRDAVPPRNPLSAFGI